jgi:hypothetical protein
LLKPSDMFQSYQPLPCMYCKKDLLRSPESAVFGFMKDTLKKKIVEFYWACEEDCASYITTGYEGVHFIHESDFLQNLLIPSNYLSWSLANLDVIRSQTHVYTDDTYRHIRQLFLACSQFVFRNHRVDEFKKLSYDDKEA